MWIAPVPALQIPLIRQWMYAIQNDLTLRQILPMDSCISYLVPAQTGGTPLLAGFAFLVEGGRDGYRGLILQQFWIRPGTPLEYENLREFPRDARLPSGEPLPQRVDRLTPPGKVKRREVIEQMLFKTCEQWVQRAKPGHCRLPAPARFTTWLQQLNPAELMPYYQNCSPDFFGRGRN